MNKDKIVMNSIRLEEERKKTIGVGDFVKPISKEARWLLEKTWYLVESVKVYNKNSKMIKLKGEPLSFNSEDFEIIKL